MIDPISGALMGASVISGFMGSGAAKRAAAEQAATSRAAIAEQRRQYDQTRADQQPWMQAGGRALNELENKDNFRDFQATDFQADPGYQFRMDEANKALQRSKSALGSLQSGSFAKALIERNQNMASQEYGNAVNRFNANRDFRRNHLGGLAGAGQTSTAQVGQAGANMANNVADLYTGIGNANAAGTIGSTNSWNNAIQGAGNTWMQMQMMNKPQTQSIPDYSNPYSGVDPRNAARPSPY